MKDALLLNTQFHSWRVAEWCTALKDLPADYWQQAIPGSFATLDALVRHLESADRFLYCRATETDPATVEGPTADSSIPAVLDSWLHWAQKWPVLAQEWQHSGAGEKVISFRRMTGAQLTIKCAEVALQAVDHASYHCGQLTVAFRALSLSTVPPTTLFAYLTLRSV